MTDPPGGGKPGRIEAQGRGSVAAERIDGIVVTGDYAAVDARQVTLSPGAVLAPAEVAAVAGTQNLPRRPAAVFVGRDGDLAALDSVVGPGVGGISHAIQGLGGIGKSELVLHHAWAHRLDYSLVWWITADSPDNVGVGLAELAYRLQPVLTTVATVPEAAGWAKAWLQMHAGWLLVLDNVEDPQHVAGLLAQLDTGRILVTTRRDVDWQRYGASPVRLGLLVRAESIDLLGRRTGRDEPDAADAVADQLGDLPIALDQAAAFIAERRTSISAYLTELTQRPTRLLDTASLTGSAERAVARVWQLTMTVIGERSPIAARLLGVLAWMAPDDLPRDVLSPLADDPIDIDDALALLASYSMITLSDATVSVHRLVQAVTRAGQAQAAQ
ncbi:MAG: hypothetical protein J2P57_22890, partial [Acidimicrobiaceae bacterium]|nr:hypothetical protein [Acidimicrobiaceae bacterium]